MKVAKALESLLDDLMFVGGAIVSLYINDDDRPRPTRDVDVVIQVTTKSEFYKFSETVEALGFKHDQSEDAPICRYVFNGTPVDFMPTEESVLGFKNKWFKEATEHARALEIDGIKIKVISPTYLLATKIESFGDRGKGDILGSKDAEDIISLIDGYSKMVEDVASANEQVSNYISDRLRELKKNAYFDDAIESQIRFSTNIDKSRNKLNEKLITIIERNFK